MGIYAVVCLALIVLVMKQNKEDSGASGTIVGASANNFYEKNKGKTAYFGGIQSAKFKRKVLPGELLKLEVEIIRQKGPVGIGKAVASVNGQIAVLAELTFAVG